MEWLPLVEAIPNDLPCNRHPLGFVHIELTPVASLKSGERLRVHYWPQAGANADQIGTLHDHVWSLASVVAVGSLRDRTYVPMADPAGAFDGTRVVYGEDRNEFVPAGTFNLTFDRETHVGGGAVYRIPSRRVHDTTVVEAPAVTFVLAQDDPDALAKGPLILQARGQLGVGTEVRQPFHCAEALALIRTCIASADSRTATSQSAEL